MALGHNITAPAWLVGCPVVAVVRLRSLPGELPHKIVAITRDGDQFNVHYAASGDGEDWGEPWLGHYGATWEKAMKIVAERVAVHGIA